MQTLATVFSGEGDDDADDDAASPQMKDDPSSLVAEDYIAEQPQCNQQQSKNRPLPKNNNEIPK